MVETIFKSILSIVMDAAVERHIVSHIPASVLIFGLVLALGALGGGVFTFLRAIGTI